MLATKVCRLCAQFLAPCGLEMGQKVQGLHGRITAG